MGNHFGENLSIYVIIFPNCKVQEFPTSVGCFNEIVKTLAQLVKNAFLIYTSKLKILWIKSWRYRDGNKSTETIKIQ